MPKSLGQSVNLFTAEKWLLPESVKDSGKVDLSVKLFEDTLLVPLFTHTGEGIDPYVNFPLLKWVVPFRHCLCRFS